MKKIIAFILISALSLALPAFAAQEPTESDMQIENKIRAALRYELASAVPLVK